LLRSRWTGTPSPRSVSPNAATDSRDAEVKHVVHRELGTLELTCQTLVDPVQSHSLLVYTAVPGTESHDKLQLLSVLGAQPLG
jgi:hypothetical protein